MKKLECLRIRERYSQVQLEITRDILKYLIYIMETHEKITKNQRFVFQSRCFYVHVHVSFQFLTLRIVIVLASYFRSHEFILFIRAVSIRANPRWERAWN